MDAATLLLLPAWLAFILVWLVGATRTARTVKRAPGWDRALIALAVSLVLALSRAGVTPLGARFLTSTTVTLLVGLVLAYGGLAFAIWARVHLGRYWSGMVTLKEDHRLIRTGPYEIVRNPIYTGILTAFLGAAIAEGAWLLVVAFLVMVAAFLIKIRAEEKLLAEQFGEEFAAYVREVPRLVPGVW